MWNKCLNVDVSSEIRTSGFSSKSFLMNDISEITNNLFFFLPHQPHEIIEDINYCVQNLHRQKMDLLSKNKAYFVLNTNTLGDITG